MVASLLGVRAHGLGILLTKQNAALPRKHPFV